MCSEIRSERWSVLRGVTAEKNVERRRRDQRMLIHSSSTTGRHWWSFFYGHFHNQKFKKKKKSHKELLTPSHKAEDGGDNRYNNLLPPLLWQSVKHHALCTEHNHVPMRGGFPEDCRGRGGAFFKHTCLPYVRADTWQLKPAATKFVSSCRLVETAKVWL